MSIPIVFKFRHTIMYTRKKDFKFMEQWKYNLQETTLSNRSKLFDKPVCLMAIVLLLYID